MHTLCRGRVGYRIHKNPVFEILESGIFVFSLLHRRLVYHVAGHSRSETISRDILYDDSVGASTSLCGEAFKRIGGYNVSNLESVVLRSCGFLPCQSGASPPSQRRSSYLQSYLKLSLRLLNRLSKNWKSINRHSTIECVWRTPNRLTLVSEKTDFEQNTTCRGYRIRAQVLYRYPSRRRTLYPTALRQLRRSGHTRLKRQQNRRSGSKKASREIFPDREVTACEDVLERI